MDLREVEDPAAFLAAAEPFLLADEARHNLSLGLARTLVERPDFYERRRLRLGEVDGAVVGVALRTPPFPLVLARPADDRFVPALAARLAAEEEVLPGVVGGVPEADEFAAAYAAAAGVGIGERMEQGIYALSGVAEVPAPAGAARAATEADRNLLVEWYGAFAREALPMWHHRGDFGRAVDRRLSGAGDTGLRIWDDGGPVSLAGFGNPTPNGIRVGPVYTPPEFRGRGYATALVADLSRLLLAAGRRFVFLYTDLANETSNAVYRRIGYRLHSRSAEIAFAASKRAGESL